MTRDCDEYRTVRETGESIQCARLSEHDGRTIPDGLHAGLVTEGAYAGTIVRWSRP